MNTKTPERQTPVAYGSIYLDDNEDVQKVTKKQIETFKESMASFVFWDIICKKSQINKAIAVRGYVEQEVKAELEIDNPRVYVAIGFSENDRPARTAMLEFVK